MNMNWNVSRPKLSCDDFIINPPLHPREMRSADSYDKSGTKSLTGATSRRHCTVSWSKILFSGQMHAGSRNRLFDNVRWTERPQTAQNATIDYWSARFHKVSIPPFFWHLIFFGSTRWNLQSKSVVFFLSSMVDLKPGCVYSFSCNITFISII